FIHDLAIVLLISLPFFVFFRFGGMPRAKGLFRAKVSINLKKYLNLKNNTYLRRSSHNFSS
ncbi:hypothetical protein ACFZ9C_18905, partial [Acinetobacter baumannii]|uniref:hypothetical protein n=1 Tax=Acinetobacter baumannii TaxID=470 RepID=UPI003727CC2C